MSFVANGHGEGFSVNIRHVCSRSRELWSTETGEMQDGTEEICMRKEIASVDGVVGALERWAFSYSNDEMEEARSEPRRLP